MISSKKHGMFFSHALWRCSPLSANSSPSKLTRRLSFSKLRVRTTALFILLLLTLSSCSRSWTCWPTVAKDTATCTPFRRVVAGCRASLTQPTRTTTRLIASHNSSLPLRLRLLLLARPCQHIGQIVAGTLSHACQTLNTLNRQHNTTKTTNTNTSTLQSIDASVNDDMSRLFRVVLRRAWRRRVAAHSGRRGRSSTHHHHNHSHKSGICTTTSKHDTSTTKQSSSTGNQTKKKKKKRTTAAKTSDKPAQSTSSQTNKPEVAATATASVVDNDNEEDDDDFENNEEAKKSMFFEENSGRNHCYFIEEEDIDDDDDDGDGDDQDEDDEDADVDMRMHE